MNDILWLILAVVALIVELFTGTLLFLFFSISSAILAMILFLHVDITVEMQLLIFALISSIGMVFIYFRIKKYKAMQTKRELSSREALLLNSTAVVIENDRVSLQDGSYPYKTKTGEKYTIGTEVIVTKVEGLVVEVEKVLEKQKEEVNSNVTN